MFKRILKNNRGFTFLEIIMTTSILAVGFFGGMTVIQNSLLNSMQADAYNYATHLANEKLEEVMADKQFFGYGHMHSTNYPPEKVGDPVDRFIRKVFIYGVDPDDLTTEQENSGIKKVKIVVRWGIHSYDPERFQVSVEALVADQYASDYDLAIND